MNTPRLNGLSQPPLGLPFHGNRVFFFITFVLLADLIPKRLALINPEGVALRTIGIMQGLYFLIETHCMVF